VQLLGNNAHVQCHMHSAGCEHSLYCAALNQMRVKRRRAHIAIWRTGLNEKTGQTDRQTERSIALCPGRGHYELMIDLLID